MDGITYQENFIDHPALLFSFLRTHVAWDERMAARKTASFGQAYNYSQIKYPFQAFPDKLLHVLDLLEKTVGFRPNNCLINYYLDGQSSMGFHSDQTDILLANTGVGIVSLGETRILRFRRILKKEESIDFELAADSLLYMTQEVQKVWQHAIPRTDTKNGRMSVTFRKIQA